MGNLMPYGSAAPSKRPARATTPRAIYTGVGAKKLRFADIDEAQLLAAAEDMFSTWRSSSDKLIASYLHGSKTCRSIPVLFASAN